jgi:ribosomal protein S18 acetylase RimI-like enzyme
MQITVLEYQPADRQQLVRFMEMLQDHIAAIDPLRRIRRLPEYGELYTKALLQKIAEHSGVIYLARQGQQVLGCIAGNIEELHEWERAGTAGPGRSGRILELIVLEDRRGQGIGAELMQRIEAYFLANGCDIVRVEVFVPNVAAHEFYARLAYADRVHDMIKQL